MLKQPKFRNEEVKESIWHSCRG